MEEPKPGLSDVLAQKRTSLAVKRTVMAADRSLMAWIRTSLSMIGFGFTIYKFMQYLRDEVAGAAIRSGGPRNLGMFLVGLGVLAIVLGVIQYASTVRTISDDEKLPIWGATFFIALVMAALGIILFLLIASRSTLL